MNGGLPPTGTKKIPDFSLTIKQFSLLNWQQDQIFYCFELSFVSAPFHSWLTNFGHVTIYSIVTVLLSHGRYDHVKMFGDLSFCLSKDNANDQNDSHIRGTTILSFTLKYFAL